MTAHGRAREADPNNHTNDLPTEAVRCDRCSHPIQAPASVLRGLGPVCRRLEAQGAA